VRLAILLRLLDTGGAGAQQARIRRAALCFQGDERFARN